MDRLSRFLPEKRRGNFLALSIIQVHLWPLILVYQEVHWKAVYSITVVAIVITWFFFRNWDWIIRNWWFRKGNLAFKQLIPDLKQALLICSYIDTSKSERIEPGRDYPEIVVLLSRLTTMDIGLSHEDQLARYLGTKKTETIIRGHLMQTLEYAENQKYKEYVEILKKRNKDFAEKLKDPDYIKELAAHPKYEDLKKFL